MGESDVTTRDLARARDDDPDFVDESEDREQTKGEDSGQPAASASTVADAGGEKEPLLPGDQTERYTSRWQGIQARFVDQPRQAVEHADGLVADLMQRLAAGFSEEREKLESQWDSGDDVSTEDLRVALTRYRSFFDRLLSA